MGIRSTKSGLVNDHGPSGYVNGKDIDELRLSEPTFSVDFDTSSKIFDLRPALAASMTPKERNLFQNRLFMKLSGLRRGRLLLPQDFPSEVRALSKLSTGQLRHAVYRVCSAYSPNYVLNYRIVRYINQVYPGLCRTVRPNMVHHVWQSGVAKPLRTEDWPRLATRSAWPSSPTFNEMLEMQRGGLQPLPMMRCRETPGHTSLKEFNENVKLRARIIAKQIIGIRSDVKISSKYLDRFRYGRGFLILTAPFNLPTGLVRELAGQWIRNPHNLWLREKVSLKNFLRTHLNRV